MLASDGNGSGLFSLFWDKAVLMGDTILARRPLAGDGRPDVGGVAKAYFARPESGVTLLQKQIYILIYLLQPVNVSVT